MKTKHYIFFFGFVLLFLGCHKEKADEVPNDDPVHGIWNVINVSGGFAGIDYDFDKGVITWDFDANNSTLEVQNNNTSNNIFNGLSSGNYHYSIVKVGNGRSYLFVGTFEVGRITISENEMTINQNDMSIGTGADRFVFKLVR